MNQAKQNVKEFIGAQIVIKKGQIKLRTEAYPNPKLVKLYEEEKELYEWLMCMIEKHDC